MNDTIDPIARINELRMRSMSGEDLTDAEIAESIKLLRQQRTTVTQKKATKKNSMPEDLTELFSQPKA